MTKKQLREIYKNKRRMIGPMEKAALDSAVADCFLNSEMYKNCSELLIYVSFDIEVGTYRIIDRALKEKKVFCPRCCSDSNYMEFYMINSFDDLSPGAYGILEPSAGELTMSFEPTSLCIVPALSYDEKGNRLGFGKGYYDRFLSGFKGIKTGICYELSLCETLPADDHDIRVDNIVTEDRIIFLG